MITNENIQTISSIGTLILSLSTFCLTLYIYKKISFKSDFKRKQLDTVYKLIEDLHDTIIIFSCHGIHESQNISSGNMIRFFQLKLSEEKYEELNGTETFLVTKDPSKILAFIKYSEHPYMIHEIALIIREFVAYVGEPVNLNNFNSFTVLGGTGILDIETHYQIIDNPVYKDYKSFCDKCIDLDKAIHKWMKSIGIKNFNKKSLIE